MDVEESGRLEGFGATEGGRLRMVWERRALGLALLDLLAL